MAIAKFAKVYDEYEQRARHYEDPETALQSLISDTSWIRSFEQSTFGRGKGKATVLSRNPTELFGKETGIAMWKLLHLSTWFHRTWIIQEGTVPVPTTFNICHISIPAEAVYLFD